MYLLGVLLPDHKALKIALTSFYGIGRNTSLRLMARLQIHERALVGELNPQQLTQLTAFLSSPSTAPPPPMTPLADISYRAPTETPPLRYHPAVGAKGEAAGEIRDKLAEIRIESELRREIRENIAHHKDVGSYKGRRHAMGMPVRGQNTRTNAMTARKLNKIERRG